MNLSLESLMIFVPDLARARRFYRDVLGFAVTAESERRVTFLVGTLEMTAFLCERHGQIGDYANEARSVFVFRVEAIKAAMAEMRAQGVVFIHAEPVRGEGVRYAAFVDPFGNVHEIAEVG